MMLVGANYAEMKIYQAAHAFEQSGYLSVSSLEE